MLAAMFKGIREKFARESSRVDASTGLHVSDLSLQNPPSEIECGYAKSEFLYARGLDPKADNKIRYLLKTAYHLNLFAQSIQGTQAENDKSVRLEYNKAKNAIESVLNNPDLEQIFFGDENKIKEAVMTVSDAAKRLSGYTMFRHSKIIIDKLPMRKGDKSQIGLGLEIELKPINPSWF